jgi:hypothetical protein
MSTGPLESIATQTRTVLCPRCGLPCSLMPLKRPGAYRLVDPDGHGHAAVCIAAIQPAPAPVRYRPVSAPRAVPAPQTRPMAATARRA